ncbi:hypothetical protein VTL71DRAFT_14778 [Oculimacula yallundae]|uniref:Uncharacterized protein n=1 Tax=Oculimacula yallundae TaxID=86028 RepID=A0ABR4CJG5_9HELO
MNMAIEEENRDGSGENWSIYRDALLPTSFSHAATKPKPKPWERAPVSAHAPRLAGQKIWKKASSLQSTALQSNQIQDKENAVQADLELEKGGLGARKKRRGMGGKENIGEAKFMAINVEEVVEGHVKESSPKKNGSLRDEDAFLVPRKRTNANHLITPRKALRPIENNTIVPTLQVKELESPTKATKIQLKDVEVGEQQENEKPRRRKSMRKSRRLTKSDLVEDVAEDRRTSFVFGQTGGVGSAEKFSRVDALLKQHFNQAEEASVGAENFGGLQESLPVLEDAPTSMTLVEADEIPEPVSTAVGTDSMDSHIEQPTPLSEVDEAAAHNAELVFIQQSVESEPETPSNADELSKVVIEDLEDHSGAEATVDVANTEQQPNQAANETADIPSLATEQVQLEPIAEQPPRTPIKASQLYSAPLESNGSSIASVLSPTKSVATPRSRRKTPQRSATRRSTRTTRNSSMSGGEPSSQVAPGMDGPAIETSDAGALSVENQIPVVEPAAIVDNIAFSPEDELIPEPEHATADMSAEILLGAEQCMDKEVDSDTARPTNTVDDHHEELQLEELSLATAESADEISAPIEDMTEEDSLEQESCDEQLRQDFDPSSPEQSDVPPMSMSLMSEPLEQAPSSEATSEESAENFELIEPISITTSTPKKAPSSPIDENTDFQESFTPDPTTTELTEMISENAPPATYDHDDTDMLRNFLSKVKADKAAKAKTSIPKRKRSLPHSPLQIPLETADVAPSPASPKPKDDFDVSLPTTSPSKRRKRNEPSHRAHQEEVSTEPQSIRRSGRTRLPVKAAPAAPSFIPVRRIGQDGDSTITLRRNEEKELAALTKVNTRKNKSGASHPLDWLEKEKEEKEKDDPASRQRALKEVFDEKNYKQKLNKKGLTVVWAEELAQFQTQEGKKAILPVVPEKEGKKVVMAEKESEKEKEKPILPGDEKRSISTPKVKVGIRSKMTLGMASNGTPAPKRRVRGRP